jgi:DNA-binding MarR family transcriptional regulator
MLRPRGSKKAAQFTESVIREMTRLALEHGAVNLAQGFPDFACATEIKDAASAAIYADINQYAITWGARDFREAIAEKIGVSGANYTMLMSTLHLQGTSGVSISALADYLEVSGPYVTGVINKLAAQGFVRKAANPKDKRGVLVRLTPTGRRRLLQAFEFICNVNDRLFEGVGREEYRAVANFNAKFIRNTQATLDWIDRQPGSRSRSRAADL